jgi:hypothetical protein
VVLQCPQAWQLSQVGDQLAATNSTPLEFHGRGLWSAEQVSGGTAAGEAAAAGGDRDDRDVPRAATLPSSALAGKAL